MKRKLLLLLVLCLFIVGCEAKPSYEGEPEKGYKAVDRTTTELSYYNILRSTTDIVVMPTDDKKERFVYVVATGKRYHYNSDCSNMKNPIKRSISDAINQGYTPCKNCVR